MLSINDTTAATESMSVNHCQISDQYVHNLLYHAAQYDIVVWKRTIWHAAQYDIIVPKCITDVLQNWSLKAIKSLIPAPNDYLSWNSPHWTEIRKTTLNLEKKQQDDCRNLSSAFFTKAIKWSQYNLFTFCEFLTIPYIPHLQINTHYYLHTSPQNA